jgi:dienelactone hydrolase
MAAAVVGIVGLAAGACASDGANPVTGGQAGTGPSTSTVGGDPAAGPLAVHAEGSYGVGRRRMTFVDATHITKAHGGRDALPNRTLDTLVLYPTAGPATPAELPDEDEAVELVDDAEALPGPWPVVLFSHGSTAMPDDYAAKAAVWASAGYLVVAPAYPLSKTGVPGGTDNGGVEAQAGDVSFVLDEVAAATDGDGPLAGLADLEHVALAGHSFGAVTSLAAGFNACCADDRVDAVASFSGWWFGLSSDGKVADGVDDLPLLSIHGTDDESLAYDEGHKGWELIDAPKLFVTLVDDDHNTGFHNALGSVQDRVVTRATLAFLDAELKGDPTGLDRLRAEVDEAGPKVATLEDETS